MSPRPPPAPAALSFFAAAALSAFAFGCVSAQSLAQGIANAARPTSLPLVVSCWEKELEAADLRAEYIVTASFVVEANTSHIRDAAVTRIEPSRDTPPRDTAPFTACLVDALNRSALPVTANADGPGFSHSADVSVASYRIAFTDPTRDRRRNAAARQAHVLLGPRSDRCQGLYTHDPPRGASTLYTEIATAEELAARYKDNDRDLYARELQKSYDARVELRDRLALDLAEPGIPEANKKRLKKALDDAEAAAQKTGSMISCTPPPRS